MRENNSKNDVKQQYKQIGFRRQKLQQVTNEQIQMRLCHHKQIMKRLNNTSRAYHRISKSYFGNKYNNKEIKSGMISLGQNLQSQYFVGLSHNSCKNALQIICQANSSLSDHCNEYFSQIINLHNLYTDLVKNKHSNYIEQRDNVDHYVKKVSSLSRDKQKQKYQRNKSKLLVARADFDRVTNDFHNFLGKINEQAEKIWQSNFVNFTSIFTLKFGQTFQKIKQMLQNHKYIDSQQIILDQQDEDIVFASTHSVKFASQNEKITKQLNRFLHEKFIHDQQITIKDAFKPKQNPVKNIKNQNKVTINSNIKPNPIKTDFQDFFAIPAKSNQIKQVKTLNLNIPKNDFSCFNNILSTQMEILSPSNLPIPKSATMPSAKTPTSRKNHDSHFNFNTPQLQSQNKKQTSINLLDL